MNRPRLRISNTEQDQTKAVSDFLEMHGRYVLGNAPMIANVDAQQLALATNRVGSDFDQMSRLIQLTMNDTSAALAHDLLSKLMIGSWIIGVSATLSPEAKKWGDTVKGQAANKKKVQKSGAKNSAMQNAIRDEAEGLGQKLVASEKCARAIQPGVCRRCAVEEDHDGFSWSTIKKQIGLILKASGK